MPNVRYIQRSFSGGEITPEMFAKHDDIKFQSGAATLRNFIAKPQGPAQNRPGTEFVGEVKDSSKKTRLIPFTYSTTQTMCIEVGNAYMRFHTQGATLLAGTPSAYDGGATYGVGDLVSSGGVNYYCIAAVTGTAPPNATYWYQLPSEAYEIPTPYLEEHLFDLHFVQSADVLTIVHPSYPVKELKRLGATKWTLVSSSFASPIAAPGQPTVTAVNCSVTKYTYNYLVTAIASDGISESGPSQGNGVPSNLNEVGCTNKIEWAAVSGASRYNVYKEQGGVYGYIGNTTGLYIIDDNIAPDMGTTPPAYDTVFNTAGAYPSAVSYYEQRKCFAGSLNDPHKIWMTKSGTENNFSYSLPIKDDDRIAFRVAAREANTIRHIVPLSQLLLLTSSAEWRVTSVNSDAITPTSISVMPQSYVGASNVQPVIINNSIVYCAARGGHVRELGYNWQAQGFATGDLSLRAAHLFDGYEIVDMSFTKAPEQIVWMVSNTGKLLGFTYIPEQQIGAWHQHDTDGLYESCAVVAEGEYDALYVVVQRTIDGQVKRYVERFHTRAFDELKDAFFVDCGGTYDGRNTGSTTITITGGTEYARGEVVTMTASASLFANTDVGNMIVITDANDIEYRLTITSYTSATEVSGLLDRTLTEALQETAVTDWSFAKSVISGLTWLEGETVSILADGAVHPQQVVDSGAITLDRPASLVHVGLPYYSDLQTLPFGLQIDTAFGQGRYKNVNKAWVRVYRSSGIFVGPDADRLTEAKQRTTEPYGSPPDLKSEEIPIMITPSWADSGQVYIRQSDPLPLTIVGLTLEVSIGG